MYTSLSCEPSCIEDEAMKDQDNESDDDEDMTNEEEKDTIKE